MPRYWIIAPVEADPREQFDKAWQFDLANHMISIGWHELGDVSKMTRQQLSEAVASTYPEKPPQTKGLITNMIWNFHHEIGPDDFVIARRGRKILAGIGQVTLPAFYSPQEKNHFLDHHNFLGVDWHDQPRNRDFSTIVFPMHTVAETTESEFRKFTEGSPVEAVALQAVNLEAGIENANEFVLEKYLEEFIVSNFQAIFKGELAIYKDDEGNDGQQYATEVGPIDILAVEPKSKSFVVIELKKGRPSDQVIGQTLRYMGWVKEILCKDGQAVKGLVICRDPDQKLTYALKMAPHIDLRYYSVSFKLSEMPRQ